MYMAHERRQYILRLLEQRGRIHSASLARELRVTDETIRTDLVALQQKGLLKRVHGGAEYVVPIGASPQNDMRADVAMAQLVAQQITSGAVIYADAVPFTRVLAAALADSPCTFITPSPQLALQLAPAALPHTVISTGGILDKDTKLFCGSKAEMVLEQTPPQVAVLRPHSLAPASAAYLQPQQARWAQLAAQLAKQCLVAVPSSAFTAQAPHEVLLPSYSLITEDNIPGSFQGIPAATIPYISAEMLIPEDDFDF